MEQIADKRGKVPGKREKMKLKNKTRKTRQSNIITLIRNQYQIA